MSIATQRAKERENRTPDVKVMVKTVNQPRLNLGGAEVLLGRAVVPLLELSGSTAWSGRKYRWCRDEIRSKMDDFGAKSGWISWMGSGETWGDARSTRNQANLWIKSNKTSSHQQITKKYWGHFWWGFSKLGKNTTKLG